MDSVIDEIDALIRAGKAASARERLRRSCRGRVPRGSRAKLARLAWRARVPELGLRLLNPLVRSPARRPVATTDDERAQYAACLVRVGAPEEALELLATVADGEVPEALLFRSLAHVARWEYRESMPLLRRYLEAPGVGGYQSLVGRINLAAALVFERHHEEAAELLERLLRETDHDEHRLLHGNCLEISAESAVWRRDWSAALRFVGESRALLRGTGSIEELMLAKWEAVIAFLRSPGRDSLARLSAVRRRAVELSHWETVRECDRVEAVGNRDEALFLRLHFGTPYPSFRRQLVSDYPTPVVLPDTHVWWLRTSPSPKVIVDVVTGEITGHAGLRSGFAQHKLLFVLASDSYRPFRLAEVHARAHPGDRFNPVSSPLRIYQATSRANRRLAAARLPLRVTCRNRLYRLDALAAVGIRRHRGEAPLDRQSALLRGLKAAWPSAPFSRAEAEREAGFPARSVSRVLREAVDRGVLECLGRARATRFRFR